MSLERLQRQINELRAALNGLQTAEVQRFVALAAPLTSTSWDGDARSTTAKTLIDLSAVFSAPAGIKAVLVRVAVADEDSAATVTRMILSPNDTASSGIYFVPLSVNDRFGHASAIIPCDANGDIYFEITASGALTFDAYLEIWGYWL